MNKIKAINITGIRGVKDRFPLLLDKRSILIFGENGTGKSSLTDALEWFYKDRIEHLSSEEVGTKNALRNIFLLANEDAKVEILFANKNFDNEKSINNSLTIFNSNSSKEFANYYLNSNNENLILRYRDLVQFITATKSEKLIYLQRIIGFNEVREIRGLLKKFTTKYSKEIKQAGYSNKKSQQQSILMQCLGQNIVSPKQFFDTCNRLIEPLKLGKKISSYKDARQILKSIEEKEDIEQIEQIAFHNKIAEVLAENDTEIDEIQKVYKTYYRTFTELKKDADKLSKLQLLKLLTEGLNVLKKDVVKDNYCPLCQQDKNKIQLIKELAKRIEDLKELEKEKNKIEEYAEELNSILETSTSSITSLLKEKLLKEKENATTLKKLQNLKLSLTSYNHELKKDILSKEVLTEPSKLTIDRKENKDLIAAAKKNAKDILDSQKGNIKIQIAVKLSRAIDAYINHRRLEKEQEVLTNRHITFDALYSDFIKRQEEALDGFLKMFSSEINKYYNLMNPGEKVEDIKLIPIKDKTGEELEGITIDFKFFNKRKTPPSALLSESHINCLGISFFLASVKAFNKVNRFVVLDDVISSFDSNHRTRFIRMLVNEFEDYQIILLTHEKDFFDIASSEAKRKNWLVTSLSWTAENGTSFETPLIDLRATIEQKIAAKNTDGLGNDIRKYGERQLKQIANNIEAKVVFRFNEQNEERMLNELLSSVQGTINKQSPSDLKNKNNIDSILGSPLLIGNKTSHDNTFKENISDLEVFWDDIKQLVKTFYCGEEKCKSFVAMRFYDTAKNQIRCKCGKLYYDWKK
jgi:energy-coupling factor transporter ATP-binding protein EcfA2